MDLLNFGHITGPCFDRDQQSFPFRPSRVLIIFMTASTGSNGHVNGVSYFERYLGHDRAMLKT